MLDSRSSTFETQLECEQSDFSLLAAQGETSKECLKLYLELSKILLPLLQYFSFKA